MINHNVFLYFDIISHSSLLFMWYYLQSLMAIGVLRYPITIFMEKRQAQYKWRVNRDYLEQSSKDA
jgi:hypothetical protein